MPSTFSTRQPKYRKHKSTGQAVCTLDGRDHYLGRHGTKASEDEYNRIISEWLANGRRLPAITAVTVAEVIKRYWPFVEQHYRKADGAQTSEVTGIRYSLRPLRHLYGTLPAAEFGPLKFKAVRLLLVDGYEHGKYGHQNPVCRRTVNHRMERIRRLFRWATENELIPPSVYHGLLAVRGLQRGRTEARESPPVRPVPEALVDAIRPFVSCTIRALIDLQLLTGARPGELTIMRGRDLDTTGRIWIYKPESHKTEHHGHQREIYLGPQAQLIVKPFLQTNLEAYLFSPQQAEAERFKIMRENRQSKVQPSQISRKKKNPKQKPGDVYGVTAYRRAITRACMQAFPLPLDLLPMAKKRGEKVAVYTARVNEADRGAVKKWYRDHHFHPHQLRHNAATNLRREYGVETARIILGHKNVLATQIYAEVDKIKAMKVIGEVG